MVIGASLIWTTVAAAALTQLTVRVEGKEKTLFEGPILTEGHEIKATSDTQYRECDAMNGGAHAEPMATPTAAAVDALELVGQTFDATWSAGYDDYFISRFGPDTEDPAAEQYWGAFANGVSLLEGGCQYGARVGEEVLWVYDAFGGRELLRLQAAADASVPPTQPLPTAYVEVGEPLRLEVTASEGYGGEWLPAEGVTVAPVDTEAGTYFEQVLTGDSAAVTTDAGGEAEVTFTTPGWHRIKAQEESGYIRSNRLDVCVEPAGGGGCGPLPADAALRVPAHYRESAGGGGSGGSGGSTTPTSSSQTPTTASPSNVVSLSRPGFDRKKGTARLAVVVPGPGHVSMTGTKTVARSVDVGGPGTVQLTIKPTAKELRGLRKRGKLRVGVKIAYTPTGGTTAYTWRSVQLTTSRLKKP